MPRTRIHIKVRDVVLNILVDIATNGDWTFSHVNEPFSSHDLLMILLTILVWIMISFHLTDFAI